MHQYQKHVEILEKRELESNQKIEILETNLKELKSFMMDNDSFDLSELMMENDLQLKQLQEDANSEETNELKDTIDDLQSQLDSKNKLIMNLSLQISSLCNQA